MNVHSIWNTQIYTKKQQLVSIQARCNFIFLNHSIDHSQGKKIDQKYPNRSNTLQAQSFFSLFMVLPFLSGGKEGEGAVK